MPELATEAAAQQTLVPALRIDWAHPGVIANLRGNADDPRFRDGVSQALGLALPTQACTTVANNTHRLVWVGPDDWFAIGPAGQQDSLVSSLGRALTGQHVAVTDVSSGYTLLRLSGAPARDVLAQACPLDLHPRVFGPGKSAGSLFFKASIWLWQTDSAPSFELLLRSSFRGYVTLMLARCRAEGVEQA